MGRDDYTKVSIETSVSFPHTLSLALACALARRFGSRLHWFVKALPSALRAANAVADVAG
jgi:hypothetical protein